MTHDDDSVTVGLRIPFQLLRSGAGGMAGYVADAEAAGLDRLCIGDHVSFKGGQGCDGLISATAAAMLTDRILIQTAVYLLPLRHPVPVAREIASLAALAPGRFSLGVGIGGEDPAEFHACGIDLATRGRRTDESLPIVRALLAGERLSVRGEFFALDEVRILPTPPTPIQVVIGGRSAAAIRRTARYGDGWLGLWVSPERYASACADIARQAEAAGRHIERWANGMHVWCCLDDDRDRARATLAGDMESLYRMPFDKFAAYCPYGTARDIADFLRPYVDVGCRSFNLIAAAGDSEQTIHGARDVRALLREQAS
jgi:alkanesulfonate monooxygenase SsuD/methylene tetrahydromethanopterin reductase-like flavin-dependent oxidoreductase (luciferase family)